MKIEIVTKNIENEAMVREFIHQKTQFAVERVGIHLARVRVRVEDETDSSESFEGLCQIDASLNPNGDIHVSADGESAVDSVLQAIQKMQKAIRTLGGKR